ncbi:MAG: deoxynucleoside kinase [Anaerolineales bacterium]|jgi:deoxyadenosine/deoxycytidine kinase|nr:deoxynucleoside kinase [Anaerolineales bacterium]
MAAKHLVLVAGNIGAGKTSLVTKLGEQLGWRTGFETVETNPYLGKFYGDMRAWAFHLQVFLLAQRSQLHIEAHRHPSSAILDRSIYEDYYIFARALHSLGNLSAEDLDTYSRVYKLVITSLPKPDLLIMLKAPVSALLERIQARGREMEAGITAEYLSLLDGYYDEWLHSFDVCPVLTISSGDLDYVNDPAHLASVIKTVEAKLSGRDELVFDE